MMTLGQRTQHKIRANEHAFDLFPGVVIVHSIYDHRVLYMSELGRKLLNTTNEALEAMGMDYYKEFFNPEEAQDYVPKILGLLERNNDEEIVSYFQQVKPVNSIEYQWWQSCSRIFMHDDNGKPTHIITTAIPVDPGHNITIKADRLLQENNFLRKNGELFASLGKRERQILALMAQDKSSVEISEALFLAENTVKTHRRNIKKKIGAENQYDIVRFAQAFDLV